MKSGYCLPLFLIGLLLGPTLLSAAQGQGFMMDEISVSSLSRDCGKWRINFNWSDMDECGTSVSHGDSASGKVAIATDALTLESKSDKSKVLKISVITYSRKDAFLINRSSLMELANSTLTKSKVCKDINITEREIDGQPGIFESGLMCPMNEPVYVAAYPIEYHLDRPGGILESTAVGIILSTYGTEATERFLDSVRVLQLK
jgi:hypothetical protein